MSATKRSKTEVVVKRGSLKYDQADLQPAGVIERLELTNFMCHSHLVLDFNARVNFIVGKNGSGKSAIMTGLMIVLGTRATDTSRARSLSAFVRMGCSSACVRVTLRNSGLSAYKPSAYGNKIVISRTISVRGSSKLMIGKAHGALAACGREELIEVLHALNIILPNPFALLTQETMKSFLEGKKETMFKSVEQGTGVNLIREAIIALRGKLIALVTKKKKMCQSLKNLEEELDSWQQKRKLGQKADKAKGLLDQLELEECWITVVVLETELQNKQRSMEEYIKTKEDQSAQIKKFEDKKAKCEQQIRDASTDFANAKKLYNDKKAEKDEVTREHQTSLTMICKSKDDEKNLNRELRVLSQEKKIIQEEIQRITLHSADEELKKRAEKQLELERQKEELAETNARLKDTDAKYQEQRHLMRSLEQETSNARNHLSNYKNKAIQATKDLEKMQRESNSLPPAYGNRMSMLRTAIEKANAEGLFKKKPIGPIGLEIKLKDYSWSLAMENYLRGEMRTFFCDNFDDRKQLDSIAKRVTGQSIQCVVSRFFDQPFDVSSKRAVPPRNSNILSMYDILDVADPRVMNYLIDQRRVETVLLCDDTTHAFNLMQKPELVPRYCSIMLTKDAEQVFPAPNFKVYGKEHEVEFLLKSREANVAALKQCVEKAKAECNDVKVELLQLESRLKAVKEELASLSNQRSKLQQKSLQLENLIRQANDEQDLGDGDNFDTLQGELREMDERTEKLKEEKDQVKAKITELIGLKEAASNRLVMMAAEFKALTDTCLEAENTRKELENECVKLEMEIEASKRKYNEQNSQLSNYEQQIAATKAEIMTATEVATAVGPRVDSRRHKAQVRNEIAKQRQLIQTMTTNLVPLDVIDAALDQLGKQVAEEKSNVDLVQNSITEMEGAMKERELHYSKAVLEVFRFIEFYFAKFFKSRPFEGSIDVKYSEPRALTVSMKWKGADNNASNLSGGERSYTTVALVLSVWNKLLSPFYMLDEFDVFLDPQNQKIILDMLLAEAKDRPDHQFFFFTPQDMSLTTKPYITIHKLANPRET